MATKSEYDKKSYEKHKTERKAHNKEYYQRPEVKEKANQRMKQKYAESEEEKDRQRAYKLAWYHNNKDKVKVQRDKVRCEMPALLNQFRGIKSRAKKNGVAFGFDNFDHFISCVGMPEKCPVLGVDLDYRLSGYDRVRKAQIDRIIPDLGYIPGNVAIISAKANQIKQDNTLETLQALVKYLGRE